MKKLVTTFIKYPFYSNIIIAVFLLAGGVGMLSMKKSFFPERRTRDIYVSVAYPGASPKEMEEGITQRIEESVRGIVGIKEINSTSSENFATVNITTTGEYDIDVTLQEIKNAVDGISSMPVDAERPIVYKRRNTTPAFRFAISGIDTDLITLKKYAMQIEDDMRASGIITQINISGYPDLEISVEIPEENLLRYDLTFDEVQNAITLNNTDISAGQIRSEDEEVLIRSRRRSIDPNDIGEIVIKANTDGSFIRVRDVANIKLKFADVASQDFLNGKRAASFYVTKLVDEDLKAISDYINKYIVDFNSRHDRVKLSITFDFMTILNARLMLLVKNGGIGLLLVLISLGMFLSIRLSFWVAAGIPVSFLGMFMVAGLFGITINMISLFGMILVVGILVDDGIVIAENIYAHFEQGKTPRRAAIDGSIEVLPAVLTSVSTTIIAFAPILLIKQERLEFMFQMAFVVIFSLFFSLIEAFFVLPGHIGHSYILHPKNNNGSFGARIRNKLDKGILYIRSYLYGKILRWVIKWRLIMIITPVAILIITIGMFYGGIIKFTFFPAISFEWFNIDVAFTPGSGEKQTLEYLKRFEKAVWEVNDELNAQLEEKGDTIDMIKYTYIYIGSSFNGIEQGSHAGGIFVMPRDLDKTGISGFELANRIRKKIGSVPETQKFQVGGTNRFGKPVSISLLSKNLEELESAEQMLIEEMKEMDQLSNVVQTNAAGKREILLRLKPKAYFLGLNHASISKQVRQGFFGGQAQRLQDGKDELRVWVRYPKEDRITIGQLENMKIKTSAGDYPLSELADYEIQRGPVSIKRYNMSREVRVEADLTDPDESVPPILAYIDKNIIPKIKQTNPGINVEYMGQSRTSQESMSELIKYFLFALVAMAIVVMIHFKSFSQAIIIILMIPLAWIGSSWGHAIEGKPVSLLSIWGMVALSGVIINDAVVFLSKYNLNLQKGLKVTEAIYEAGSSRFRPIILTTITTTAGLYPLVLEKSFQAQFLIPMAVALAYGVFFGTIFILLFFPSLIMFLNDVKVGIKWIWTGKRPTREEVEKVIIYQKQELEKLD